MKLFKRITNYFGRVFNDFISETHGSIAVAEPRNRVNLKTAVTSSSSLDSQVKQVTEELLFSEAENSEILNYDSHWNYVADKKRNLKDYDWLEWIGVMTMWSPKQEQLIKSADRLFRTKRRFLRSDLLINAYTNLIKSLADVGDVRRAKKYTTQFYRANQEFIESEEGRYAKEKLGELAGYLLDKKTPLYSIDSKIGLAAD